MSRLKLLKVLLAFTKKKKNHLHHISFTRTVLILISHWLAIKLSMASTVLFYFVLVSPCEPQDHHGSLSRPVPLGPADWLRTLGGVESILQSRPSMLWKERPEKMLSQQNFWKLLLKHICKVKFSLVLLNLESFSFIVLIVVEFAQDALWKEVLINQTCNIRQM